MDVSGSGYKSPVGGMSIDRPNCGNGRERYGIRVRYPMRATRQSNTFKII